MRLTAVESRPQGMQVTTEVLIQVVVQDRPAVIYESLILYVK
jgi:hypothetical protein